MPILANPSPLEKLDLIKNSKNKRTQKLKIPHIYKQLTKEREYLTF